MTSSDNFFITIKMLWSVGYSFLTGFNVPIINATPLEVMFFTTFVCYAISLIHRIVTDHAR